MTKKNDYEKEDIIKAIKKIIKLKINSRLKYLCLVPLIWKWTEFNKNRREKYIGCLYWSKKAITKYKKNTKAKKHPGKYFRHDHTVPKKIILEKLLNMYKPTRNKIENFMKKYCIATVVTKKEDKKKLKGSLRAGFPEGTNPEDDKWARYKKARIKPYKIKWKGKKPKIKRRNML